MRIALRTSVAVIGLGILITLHQWGWEAGGILVAVLSIATLGVAVRHAEADSEDDRCRSEEQRILRRIADLERRAPGHASVLPSPARGPEGPRRFIRTAA